MSSSVVSLLLLLVHLFVVNCLLYLRVPWRQPLQHLLVMCANVDSVLVPVASSQLLFQLIIVHHGWSHFLLVFHTPEDNTDEIEVVIRQCFKISVIFTLFESVLKSHDSRTEIILDRLAQMLLFH